MDNKKFKLTDKGWLIAFLISLAIMAVWYAFEYMQFGELQWDRDCDNVVGMLYFIVLWIGFSKW